MWNLSVSAQELIERIEWFELPSDDRDSVGAKAAKDLLETLWGDVREEIGADRFDPALGSIRAGRMGRRFNTAWAQTNDKQSFRSVNLTLDLSHEGLALNVIGWYDKQLEKMRKWLATPAARKLLRTMPDLLAVIFVREGHVGADGKPVFQNAPGREVERLSLAESSPSSIPITLTGMKSRLAHNEKLALHLRRLWAPSEVEAMERPSTAVGAEVSRWLEPLEQIRLA